MAGARTQGVGRGVNWGAFGSMGQQYAQIGRTIESGGEALGKGIGGGLAAIGGAIERKKVRDREAEERQKERTYRADRDKIMDARYDESNREQNQLFEHQLYQESLQSEYASGRGPRFEREMAEAKLANLSKQMNLMIQTGNRDGAQALFEQMNRIESAAYPWLSKAMGSPSIGTSLISRPGQPDVVGGQAPGASSGTRLYPAEPTEEQEKAEAEGLLKYHLGKDYEKNMAPPKVGMAGMNFAMPDSGVLATHLNRLDDAEQSLIREGQMADAKGDLLKKRGILRATIILNNRRADLSKMKELAEKRERTASEYKKREVTRSDAREVRAETRETKQADEAAEEQRRGDANVLSYEALTGRKPEPLVEKALRSKGGLTAEGAVAEERRREEDARKGPKAGDGPKPITRADMQQVAEALIKSDRLLHTNEKDPDRIESARQANEAIWAKGDRTIAALIGSGEWGNVKKQAAKALLERVGGDARKAAAMAMKESPDQSPERWAEIKSLFGIK